jgi:hypothetical protein
MFFIVTLIIIVVTIYILVTNNNKVKDWKLTQTLDEYLEQNHECKTESGIKCLKCGGKSIKNWGLFSPVDSRRLFICNSCGTELYRSN